MLIANNIFFGFSQMLGQNFFSILAVAICSITFFGIFEIIIRR